MSIVEVERLSKQYPSFTLKEVSFTLEEGRIAGFIGRNGAGKTTTIKSMLNLVHPSDGTVRYFGLPIAENEAAIKQRIGYSTGTVNYYPKKRLKDLAAVTKTFYPNWDEAAWREYLQLFALDENKAPAELSEGMKVKCNLAMALSHRAEVLILDEPTSGLDPFSRDELLELFLMLKERGVAILFSTHITSDLEKCADDIIYIRDGAIVHAADTENFRQKLGEEGETLEETMLRLERSVRHA
ncbi:MAG: ABC transporter ATP-binding protein [Lachnospiraceae bacterium]|nr:ABC transporter ATP-binding protein [Lachnospiraceae bacterium]